MFQKPESDAGLEAAINRVLLAMQEHSPDSDEYETLLSRLTDLNAIKATHAKNALSKDTLATIAANIAGILLILQYERVNIVGTKALSFVQKLR